MKINITKTHLQNIIEEELEKTLEILQEENFSPATGLPLHAKAIEMGLKSDAAVKGMLKAFSLANANEEQFKKFQPPEAEGGGEDTEDAEKELHADFEDAGEVETAMQKVNAKSDDIAAKMAQQHAENKDLKEKAAVFMKAVDYVHSETKKLTTHYFEKKLAALKKGPEGEEEFVKADAQLAQIDKFKKFFLDKVVDATFAGWEDGGKSFTVITGMAQKLGFKGDGDPSAGPGPTLTPGDDDEVGGMEPTLTPDDEGEVGGMEPTLTPDRFAGKM